MVTDDPFNEPVIPSRDTVPPSPILRVHSESDLQSHRRTSATNSPQDLPNAGVKTPGRRVQWQPEHHVVNLAPLNADDALEGQTLDLGNLREVNDALERFKHRRHHPGAASHLSMSSLADSDGSHPSEGRNSEEDYDYRLDKDPVNDDDNDYNDGRLDEQILNNPATEQLYAYAPPGETDGLPSIENNRREEAVDLVRAHTSKWGALRRRVHSGSVKRSSTKSRRERQRGQEETDSEKRTSDEPLNPPSIATGANPSLNPPLNPPIGSGLPHMPGGASVLSTLLTLYNQQQVDSATTTPTSSRPASTVGSLEDEERPLVSPTRKHGFWQHRQAEEFSEKHRSKSMTSIADRETSQRGPGLIGSFQRAIDQFNDRDRPKAARSSAGVIGALIQNTGAVAAAAAPTAATLIPAAKKGGYTLRRYDLSETASRPPSRPSSNPNSRPPSRPPSRQGSVYSISASPAEPSPAETEASDLPRSKSSDNVVMMKKKPPGRLNLKTAKGFLTPGSMTPAREKSLDDTLVTEEERRRKEREEDRKRRKLAKEERKRRERFIITHVAAILSRQNFILKLSRALMMMGSPSHRLETQIQATARVLEINAQVVYLPGTMLVSFGDDATHTSETKFLKQATGLDLGKLKEVHDVYWDVVHDEISVEDASTRLDYLMTSPPVYNAWQTLVIGCLCSSFICIPSFHGSFLDALMSAPLGGLLVGIQLLAARNDMFSNVFEITVATLVSFLAAVLASTGKFCYTALVSGGIVLILPGYIVLTGALELASRNVTAGSVRIAYSLMYSLFLGFGISLGGEIFQRILSRDIKDAEDYMCHNTHYPGAPWYMQTPSGYWNYLCVPGYSLFLSLRNQQPIFNRELPVMVAIACAGWVTNHFSAMAFPGRSDIISALGSFCVGILGNLYGRFFSKGASFPVMVVGILFQLPSGLSENGLFSFAADSKNGSAQQYSEGFGVAQQLVSVAIGLTVGLFVSAVVMYPLGGSRRRGAGIFSF